MEGNSLILLRPLISLWLKMDGRSKEELMGRLAEEVRRCTRCELYKGRRNVVVGEGSLDADVMLVGEAPGYWEDVKGRPFVGAAGKLLDELLADIGLSRGEIYIANVLKCRPPKNRDPRPEEVEACTPYLDRQIRIISPRVIVSLGRHSTRYLLGKAGLEFGQMRTAHGQVYQLEILDLKLLLMPTYHPAAALYNPRYRQIIEEDLQVLKELLRREAIL